MEKIHSGIEGFDKLVYGGLPKGRSYLVAGEPGTGKSIFLLQFLASKFAIAVPQAPAPKTNISFLMLVPPYFLMAT
mgnify:CR=1 FL=1